MPIHDWTRVTPEVYHPFHVIWLGTLAGAVNRVLPSGYYAMPEMPSFGYIPVVLTLSRSDRDRHDSTRQNSGGGMSLATRPPKVQYTSSFSPARRSAIQRSLVVRSAGNDQVVAVVEVVSPSNKADKKQFQTFVNKAVDFILRGIHFFVIDLFPPTRRDPQGIHFAIWSELFDTCDFSLPPNKPLTLASYVAGDDDRAFVNNIAVGDPFPEMPLFLDPETYVDVPIEESYVDALKNYPSRWIEVLSAPSTGEAP